MGANDLYILRVFQLSLLALPLSLSAPVIIQNGLTFQYKIIQWRRSQVKSGGINIEKIEGVGSGEYPPQLGVWGLAPEKNQFCAKNYAILSKFWYFFPILQQKVGDYPPSPESGGPIPCPPCSDAYGYIPAYLC